MSVVHLTITPLDTFDLRREASALYRAVFGYTDANNGVSPRLLRGLSANGGSAIGALDGDGRLIGFSYGFMGTDGETIYHYSQATAVAVAAQGTGVGRRLKQAQAELARSTGATSMRWAFDPANPRNGHFNLDLLGGVGRWFHPDFYDEPDTDRMIIDWPLAVGGHPSPEAIAQRERALAALPRDGEPMSSGTTGEYSWLRLPAVVPADPAARRSVRCAVATAAREAIDRGRAAVSCRRIPETQDAVYLFGGIGA